MADYKGLETVVATGAGGQLVINNFMELADRAGPVYATAGNPTVNHDSSDTAGVGVEFYVWSKWHNTSNDRAYLCVDATATAAVWIRSSW